MMIDELNIREKYTAQDFYQYFKPMAITEKQKETRTETANDLWYVFLMLFVLISQGTENADLDYMFILQEFRQMFSDTVSQYARMDDYINEYIETFTTETLDTTWKHMDLGNPDDYWLSDERAGLLALNESNTVNNYEDLQKAIENGYTHKTWKAEMDSRTRKTHSKMDGKKIEIDKYFEFPDCKMIAPHDTLNGSNKELCNCRCSCVYTKE